MYLVGIGGPSGSGKTELARAAALALGAPLICLDSYYLDLGHLPLEKRIRMNFDEPDALEHDLLREHLCRLTKGEPSDIPVYDFARHTRATGTQAIRPSEYCIVEGLFALYWKDVRALLGTKVYVETPDAVCFERRMARDVRERGRTPESVTAQYWGTVHAMAKRYIWPTRAYADLVVSGVHAIERSLEQVVTHAVAREAPGRAALRSSS